jgi:hypothetical protein
MAKQARSVAEIARDAEDFTLMLGDKLDWIDAILNALESAAKSDDPLLGQRHIALLAGAARYLGQEAHADSETFREQACGVQV